MGLAPGNRLLKHFLKIAEGVDVLPALHALALNPDLWDENTLRTTHPDSPHQDVSDIWVWFNDPSEDVPNAIQTQPYRAWTVLHPLRPMVLDLMRRVDGVQLGRVIVSKLAPGKGIPNHVDEGAPAEFYSRYHIALQCLPGAMMTCAEEHLNMRSGEVWKVNNRVEHSVFNNSADDRIVVIVDVRNG